MNMQFLNVRINHPYNKNNNSVTVNNAYPLMGFSRRNSFQQSFQEQIVKPKEVVPVSQNDPKKIRWGAPTWYLFHTLVYKIKDEHFSRLRIELLNNIIAICRNLPCPKCSMHASEYISRIDVNSIRTKDDFKNLLFKFHNDVNLRTGSPLFSYNELDAKYSTAVTMNIIQNFFIFFQDKTFNVTNIANSMHRERIITKLKEWFKTNINCFDM